MTTTTPRQLGRYELIRCVGEGGMGVVWEAQDRESKARVALKVLRELDPDSIFRFKYEFRSLCQISTHRNLIRYHELVEDQGHWYFTMDLLENAKDFITYLKGSAHRADTTWTQTSNLQNFVAAPDGRQWLTVEESAIYRPDIYVRPPPVPARNIDFDRIRSLFLELAQGVAYLHRFHRLHRDLKPSNVLVTDEGRVVLLDFGLITEFETSTQREARTTGPVNDQVRQTEIIGTFDYMAPEQAAGQRLSPASDWYAVGVMLFQALTGGDLPFRGHPRVVVNWKQTYEAPSPSELRSGVPEDLVRLCRQLLRRDAAERPSSEFILRVLRGSSDPKNHSPEPTPAFAPRQQIFVGRNDQLTSLMTSLARVRDGNAVVCHVQGTSGSGKSTLADRFIRQAIAEGALVLRGRCFESETVPYKAIDAVIDALTKHLLSMKLDAVLALLPDGTETLARMFPSLNRIPIIRQLAHDSFSATEPKIAQQTAFGALANILRRLSIKHTVLIAIDDLQWSDAESVSLLSSLIADSSPPPVCFLFVYRCEEIALRPNLQAIASLPASPSSRLQRSDIIVAGLTPAEATQLASALLGPSVKDRDRIAQRIAEQSDGIALFVHELARHVVLTGVYQNDQVDLDSAIWQRLSSLPAAVLVPLEFIAIASGPIRLAEIQQALATPEFPLSDIIQLRDSHFIDLEGTHVEHLAQMAHDRIREAVVRHMPPEIRVERHRALGLALELVGEALPDELAYHFSEAGDAARTCHYSILAGEEALRQIAFEHAERSFHEARKFARSAVEHVRSAEHLIHFYTDTARFGDAYAVAVETSKKLGDQLPPAFSPPQFLIDWLALRWSYRSISPEQLLALPDATDERHLLSMRLMNAVMKAAYQMKPQLCVWLAIRALRRCHIRGNTPDCAIAYMVYGCIFTGGIRRQYEVGHAFGLLARKLVDRYANDSQRAEVEFVVGYFGTSWRASITDAESLWSSALSAGQQTQDHFHVGCAAACIATALFYRGHHLEAIHVRIRELRKPLERARLQEALGVLAAVEQATQNLRSLTVASHSFADHLFDEVSHEQHLGTIGSQHFAHWYWILKMQCCYLWGDLAHAETAIREAEVCAPHSRGMLQEAEHIFFSALIRLAQLQTNPWVSRGKALRQARKALHQFQSWAKGSVENFQAREQVLAGEIERASGRAEKAHYHFTLAISIAEEFSHRHLHGLALWLRSRLALDRGMIEGAVQDAASAATSFDQWGASGIARLIGSKALVAQHIHSS